MNQKCLQLKVCDIKHDVWCVAMERNLTHSFSFKMFFNYYITKKTIALKKLSFKSSLEINLCCSHSGLHIRYKAGSVVTLYLILGPSSWVCSSWDSKDRSRGSSILLTNPNWRRFSSTTGSPSMHSMSCFLHWSSWERDVTLSTSLFRQNSTSRP